jgi:Sec-independent protein translocase protein TatA
MKLFNVGPLELLLIVILALVVFGPKRLVAGMHDIGQWLRTAAKSPLWRDIIRTTQDVRNLPNELLRETGLDQELQEISRMTQESIRIDELDAERKKRSSLEENAAENETNILPPKPPAEETPKHST